MKKKQFLVLMIFSILFSGIVLLFYYLPVEYDITKISLILRKIEDFSLSLRFSTTAQSKAQLVIGTLRTQELKGIYNKLFLVKIDNPTIEKYKTLKINNEIWKDIISHINSLEEETIKLLWFDLLLENENNSELLEAEMKKNKKIGLSFFTERFNDPKEVAREIQSYDSELAKTLKPFELKIEKDLNILAYHKINAGVLELLKSATLAACGNFERELDIYKKVPLIFKVQYYYIENNNVKITNIYYPSSTLLIVVKLLNSDLSNVTISDRKIVIKNSTYNGGKIDFTIPTDKNYSITVNYRGKHKSGFLRELSLKDIKRAGLPKNSILLFGVDVEGLTENRWNSPAGSLPSTEHLAYAIGTIFNRDFILETPPLLNIFYVLLISILVSLLLGRKIQYTIIALFVAIFLPLIIGFTLFLLRIEILTFPPLISATFSLITGQVYLLMTEEKEKKLIRQTFSKYVSPEFVNILIENPDLAKTGGQENEVTMLFSDIRGFTTISESMSAKELVEFLNVYLSRMTDIILQNKGTLDKYIGDAIVAFWGAPVKLENHAYYACLSAVKMMEALKEFNREMEQKGKTKINIGIGINSGNVLVGNIGSEKKMNYTAIGETATITEELQDENKTYGTNIIISEYTYERVKDLVTVRELDKIYLKGIEKAIKIYELLDIKELKTS